MGIFFRRKCPMKRRKWCAPIWGKYSDVKQIDFTRFLTMIALFVPKLSVLCFVDHCVYCSTFSLWPLYGIDDSRVPLSYLQTFLGCTLLATGTEQYDDTHTYHNTTEILYPYLPLLYREFALMH